MNTVTEYIEKLGLLPHPEGGYYRQLYGNDETGRKDISTIYYVLTANDISAFHRLHNVVEIWYFHAGEPLNIYVIDTDGELTIHNLSTEVEMQVVIMPEQWFAAEIPSKQGFCLVGCAVAQQGRKELRVTFVLAILPNKPISCGLGCCCHCCTGHKLGGAIQGLGVSRDDLLHLVG